jgi:hypothetical protein
MSRLDAMGNVPRYFFFDILLSAGLPVAAAYIANWAIVNRFRIHDSLGDGQLCLRPVATGFARLAP